MVPKLWSGDSNVPDTGIIVVGEAFQALEKADVAQTWRGVMPESLTRTIATIVPTHSLAHKTATAISVVVQDKVTRIWEDYAQKKRDERPVIGIRIHAADLHAQGLLLRAGGALRTFADFQALSKPHRENKLTKKYIDLGLDRRSTIPERGDILRSYVAPGDVQTAVISDKCYASKTCQVTKTSNDGGHDQDGRRHSSLSLTLRQVSRRVVGANSDGLAYAERDVVDQYGIEMAVIPPHGLSNLLRSQSGRHFVRSCCVETA
jgi:hypothetical protein